MNTEFAKALIAAQNEMPAVKPDAVGVWKNDYVTLDHLLAVVLPKLHEHGIGVAQFPTIHETGNPTLTTILIHESGETLEYVAPLFLEKQDPQKHGSAITYARRYALAAALGISDQKDDDGAAASDTKGSRPKPDKPKPPKPDEPAPDEMGTREQMTVAEAGAYTSQAGRYKGRTIEDVYREDPKFIIAVAQMERPSKAREAAQVWLAEMERLANDPELPL